MLLRLWKLITGLFLLLFIISYRAFDNTDSLWYTNHTNNTTKGQNTMTTNNNKISAESWLDYLSYNVHLRLAQRQTTKDVFNSKWRWTHYNRYTKENMLADILDLIDCNVTELTMEEWRNLVKQSMKANLSSFGKRWKWAAFVYMWVYT